MEAPYPCLTYLVLGLFLCSAIPEKKTIQFSFEVINEVDNLINSCIYPMDGRIALITVTIQQEGK